MELMWHWNEDAETLFGSESEAVDDYLDSFYGSEIKPKSIKLLAYKRMDVRGTLNPKYVAEDLIEKLDEDFGDPDGGSDPTLKMIGAAQKLIEVIEEGYVPWSCERAPEFDYEYTVEEE